MRLFTTAVCIACLLGASADNALAQRRGKRRNPGLQDNFAAAVDKAIEKGARFLKSTCNDGQTGLWEGYGIEKGPKHFNYQPYGPSALATYALIEAGVSPRDPLVAKALKKLASVDIFHTYSLALRACAFRAAIAHDAKEYLPNLRKDVRMLINMSRNGSYGYFDPRRAGRKQHHAWDNSNAQYGVLGVWMGLLENLEIPRTYWMQVMAHWKRTQQRNGGWGYKDGRTRPSMCTAGVASMLVCFDSIRSSDFLKCAINFEKDRDYVAIKRGLNWFDRYFAGSLKGRMNLGHSNSLYYYLYGVERIGLASGYKYFGQADWYKLGAKKLLGMQRGGSWGGPWGDVVCTSYALLFLVRGRNPVVFNKLQFKGDWNNRPRDLATLTRWLSRKQEKTVNWQIINLQVAVRDWHDAPILYISGAKNPKFSDADLGKLRLFVHEGGTIFSVTECNGAGFKEGIYDTYGKLFPNYKLTECKPEHPLYSIYYKLRGVPRFYIVSNGVRPLAIHTDKDLSRSWQGNRHITEKAAFEGAANVLMYVTDKGAALRRRGEALWPSGGGQTSRDVKIARVKYNGNYNPEPLAFKRFALLMAREAQTKVEATEPMSAASVAGSGAHLAMLSATGKFALTPGQAAALKKFVTGGGTLLIEAAGGDPGGSRTNGFSKAAADLVRAMFPNERLGHLSQSSPLFTMKDMKITKVAWRRETRLRMGAVDNPEIKAVILNGRPAVLVSAYDVTGGLLGTGACSVYGYSAGSATKVGSAFKVMRNIALFAAKQRR